MAYLKLLLAYIRLCSLILASRAEPVQYCIFGDQDKPGSTIDFCMGITMHQNESSHAQDLYLTFEVPRYGGSALGWTSIGLGDTMKGALMFFIYGDPTSYEEPIMSIRRSTGHEQPRLVTPADMGGADLRVVRSMWLPKSEGFHPASPTYIATVSIVCYACSSWPDTPISAFSRSQPWIWAWNSNQDIAVYEHDTHLVMHTHHAGQGGFGKFYVDMARSMNTYGNAPSFPPIRPGIAALGASDYPGLLEWFMSSPALRAHGIFMGIAFFILFPAGVMAMGSGSDTSFKYHWLIQLSASISTAFGAVAGLSSGRPMDTIHQGVGIAVILCLVVQGILGWRHHMDFLLIRQKTWKSHSHIWLGRMLMLAGWSNVLSGMRLRGHDVPWLAVVGALACSEMFSLFFWISWRRRVATRQTAMASNDQQLRDSEHANAKYFALHERDDESENAEPISSA